MLSLCCCEGFLLFVANCSGAGSDTWASHCSDFSCCGTEAYSDQASVVAVPGLSCSESGTEPTSPSLAGRYLTNEPSGKPKIF